MRAQTQELDRKAAELERRIAEINLQTPDLATRERLKSETEGLQLEKSGLEGQIRTFHSQIETLESKKITLQSVEAQLATQQAELSQLLEKLSNLRAQTQELDRKAAELELLRITYDALFTERHSFEQSVNQLRPEIDRLELQRQQILQAIGTSEKEYLQVEEQRNISRNLVLEIRGRQAEVKRTEVEVSRNQGIIAGQEEEKFNLEQKIKQYKGEIEEYENSAEIALQSLHNKLWNNPPPTKRDLTLVGEWEFLQEFSQFLESKGLAFPQRVIRAFHTSLKVQDISALAILAGISGTGKSELPQRYADYTGSQMLTLAVQPRWDSPQDLQGFYNYIEKKYKPTDLMRGLYQYENDPQMKDRLVIVLLDEMNLARVEYYFSDFLSKLETRRSQDTYLDLDVGSLPLPENQRRLRIPQQFLFVGTMNEDETTQSLSDKVLDRANVLTFGKPQKLKLREEYHQNGRSLKSPESYVSYSQFQSWMRKPDPNSEVVRKVRSDLDRANQIMEKLGHPFAHRVYQAITAYVVNYPGVMEGDREAFKVALADQFGQKLLPKLRGLTIDECHEELEQLSKLIREIGDSSLDRAFEQAKAGRYGQFQWRGFVYQSEQN